MADVTYNGWKNWETWNCKMHIENDIDIYKHLKTDIEARCVRHYQGVPEQAKRLARTFEEYFTLERTNEGLNGLQRDLINNIFHKISFLEIAESFVDDYVEEQNFINQGAK